MEETLLSPIMVSSSVVWSLVWQPGPGATESASDKYIRTDAAAAAAAARKKLF